MPGIQTEKSETQTRVARLGLVLALVAATALAAALLLNLQAQIVQAASSDLADDHRIDMVNSRVRFRYGDIALSGGYQTGNLDHVWDLTQCGLTITALIDLNGLVDDAGAHAWSQFGVRQIGYGNYNPTWQVEGAGVWLSTDFDYTENTFDPDPPGAPILDIDDKLFLQKAGGHGEGDYNLPSVPPEPHANHRIWFDRDGVDQWQAQNPLFVDGGVYNTFGTYTISLTLQATSATSGTAYLRVNELDQGFETDSDWTTMELSPAGMTFSGDMTRMQVFYGLYGYGATHGVNIEDIVVSGCQYIGPDLQISKTVTPTLAVPGQTITYTLTFTNTGTGPATGLVITDIVPDELSAIGYQPSPGLDITPTGSISYTWLVEPLLRNEKGIITITGVVSSCLPGGTTFSNTATITDPLNVIPGNISSTVWLTVLNAPPIAVNDAYTTTEDAPLEIAAAGVLGNDLDLNCDLLEAVLVSDVSTGTLALSLDGGFVYNPPPNFHGTVTFTYWATDSLAFSNVATVTLTITTLADVSLAKADSDDPVIAGDTLVYSLIAANGGPSSATDVTITDLLPAGVTFASATPGCVETSKRSSERDLEGIAQTQVTCTATALPEAESVTFHITVTVAPDITGTLTNTASVTATEPDPNLENNTATETTTVLRHIFVYLPIVWRQPSP